MVLGHNQETGYRVPAKDFGFHGTIFVRRMDFPKAGDFSQQHKHRHWHVTFIAKGRIHFECIETAMSRDFDAPDFVETPPEAEHRLTALTDGAVAFCVFSARDLAGELVNEPSEIDRNPFTRGRNYY